MRILILTLALSIVSMISYAQCKSVKNEVDKFTKKETRTARVIIGGMMMKWALHFEQDNGATLLKPEIAIIGEFNQVFDESTKFYILLENSKVLELYNTIPAKPVTKVVPGQGTVSVFTVYTLTLDLSVEDLQTLSESSVTDVKVEVPDQKIKSPKISSKDGKQISTIAKCLSETAK